MNPRIPFAPSLLALAISCLTGIGSAQTNLITNGTFDSGITGWTVSGAKFYAGLEKVDTIGHGSKDSCLVVTPDHRTNPFWLSQKVALKKGKSYILILSLRGTGKMKSTKNYSYAHPYLGNKAGVGSVNLGAVYTHYRAIPRMFEHSVVFTPKTDASYLNLAFYSWVRDGLNFKIQVDNIELYEMKQDHFGTCTSLRDNTPKSITFKNYGKPGSLYIYWLGTKRLAKPVSVPGIGGLLGLDPTGGMSMIATGVIQPTGIDSLTLTLPKDVHTAIKGQPLFWMPVQVTSLPTTVTLGKLGAWGFL